VRDEEEAVELAREMKPNMVVLDAEVPTMVERKAVDRMIEASFSRGWSRRLTRLAGKCPKRFGGRQRESPQARNEMTSATANGAGPCGGADVGGESSQVCRTVRFIKVIGS
jgi:hypothetical protein